MGKLIGIAGFILLVGIAFKAVGWKNSTADIKAVCSFAVKGVEKSSVIEEINRFESLKYADLESDKSMLIYSPASFGRSACSIKYENNKVVTSNYSFAD